MTATKYTRTSPPQVAEHTTSNKYLGEIIHWFAHDYEEERREKRKRRGARKKREPLNGKVVRIHETYTSVYEEYQGVRAKTVV